MELGLIFAALAGGLLLSGAGEIGSRDAAAIAPQIERARREMREVGVALEAYRVDHGEYPPDHTLYFFRGGPMPEIYAPLTTPVPYLLAIPKDLFRGTTPRGTYGKPPDGLHYVSDMWTGAQQWRYRARPLNRWALVSNGPDRVWSAGEYALLGPEVIHQQKPGSDPTIGTWSWGCLYDPTNGALSAGDVVVIGPDKEMRKEGKALSARLQQECEAQNGK
jgi:hypothetical protein